MSGVGGVSGGGAGGAGAAAGGAGAAAGGAGAAAVGGASQAGGAQSVGSSASESGGSSEALKPLESGEHVAPTGGDPNGNMNTMNFVELHNTSVTQINETQESGEVDWKKLIEMMMAIKLLQEMGKGQQ